MVYRSFPRHEWHELIRILKAILIKKNFIFGYLSKFCWTLKLTTKCQNNVFRICVYYMSRGKNLIFCMKLKKIILKNLKETLFLIQFWIFSNGVFLILVFPLFGLFCFENIRFMSGNPFHGRQAFNFVCAHMIRV